MQTVLVIDDDLLITAGLQQLLSLEALHSAVANDVVSAEQLIAEQFYPLILCDLRLRSDDDGLRLIERIREISPRTKVAAMTAHATPELESRVLGLGAAKLLRKPFDVDVFLSTIRELLAGLPSGAADLEAVYRATTPRLVAMMARRYGLERDQCEDVLQQAWCILLEKQNEVRDTGAWLAGTVVNLSRQTIHRLTHESSIDDCPPAAVQEDRAMTLAVRRALARLDDRSRALCELLGLEQLTYAEASAKLGIPLGSVGPLYMRAKERLKRELMN